VEAGKEGGGQAVAFNLSEKPACEVLTELVDAAAIIIGCPTYEHEIFPKVKQFLDILQVKKFSNRYAVVFGSFSWSGEATRKLNEQLTMIGPSH
jgi:flavorubredoxin